MKLSKHLRVSALVALAVAALLPGVAQAAPSGDDFDSAIEITSVPFRTVIDTTGGTDAPDDPDSCNRGEGSVWLRYTAPADGMLRLNINSERLSAVAVYTGQRGALRDVPGFCPPGHRRGGTLHATAGTTYYFLVTEYLGEGGPVAVTLRPTPPDANDNRSAATASGLPAAHEGDLSRATAEPNELRAGCDPTATQSVWFSYTPTRTRSVQVTIRSAAVSVYRARDLSEVECQRSEDWPTPAIFGATQGETYLIRIGASPNVAHDFRMELRTAPPIQPGVRTDPFFEGTTETDFKFTPYSGDRFGRPLVSGTVDLGDGTVVPAHKGEFTHRYAKDALYEVTTTGSTADGRSGTGRGTVRVETHDVSIATLITPSTARRGETRFIEAHVANLRYDEDVKVILYKIGADGVQREVGSLTALVRAKGENKKFPFTYTFDETGTVTLLVKAVILNRDDARPSDNEMKAEVVVS